MNDKIVPNFSPLHALSDQELEGLLAIANDIYQHNPVNVDVKHGTISVDANLGSSDE
jgi:hypothetical protein